MLFVCYLDLFVLRICKQCFTVKMICCTPFQDIPVSIHQMSNLTVTYRDGRVSQLEQVYIRGSKIRFLILPDMLKNAPMLKSMKNKNQAAGAGRGKAAILKAQGGEKIPLFISKFTVRHVSIIHALMYFLCSGSKRPWQRRWWPWEHLPEEAMISFHFFFFFIFF